MDDWPPDVVPMWGEWYVRADYPQIDIEVLGTLIEVSGRITRRWRDAFDLADKIRVRNADLRDLARVTS